MFKKFMDFLFKEEEYVEEEIVDVEPIKVKKQNPPQVSESTKEKDNKQEDMVSVESSHQDNIPPISTSAKQTITRIDVDDVEPEIRHSVKLMTEPEDEYKFSPVISPIYGIKKGDKGYVPPKKAVPSNEAKDEESKLNTIISPFYGKMKDLNASKTNKTVNETQNFSIEEMLVPSYSEEPKQVSLFDEDQQES